MTVSLFGSCRKPTGNNPKTFCRAQALRHQLYFLIRILNPLAGWKCEQQHRLDHVSHFIVLSHTYSTLVQKRRHMRDEEGRKRAMKRRRGTKEEGKGVRAAAARVREK